MRVAGATGRWINSGFNLYSAILYTAADAAHEFRAMQNVAGLLTHHTLGGAEETLRDGMHNRYIGWI
jgi:hypothetical protein